MVELDPGISRTLADLPTQPWCKEARLTEYVNRSPPPMSCNSYFPLISKAWAVQDLMRVHNMANDIMEKPATKTPTSGELEDLCWSNIEQSSDTTVQPLLSNKVFVNDGDWEYYAVLPNTTEVFGVGRYEQCESDFRLPRVHKRCARVPTTIAEQSVSVSTLDSTDRSWRLGMHNPYLHLPVDSEDVEEWVAPVKKELPPSAPTVIPTLLRNKRKYLRARKPKLIPHCGSDVPRRKIKAFPFIRAALHCATLFNRHANSPISKKFEYEPQIGISEISPVEKLKSFAALHNLALPDDALSRFEDLALFYLQIRDVRSTPQLIAILLAYYKTFVSGSVLRTIENFVYSLFPSKIEEQSGEFDDPDWLKYLREGKTTWNILLNCSAFERVSKLLSLCVALGMCEASSLSFSIGNFKLFSIEASKKHATSLDLLDAFANTIFYFVEGGYRVFTTGSLAPLIYSDFEAKQFDDDCARCERLAEFAKTGDVERLGNCTTNEYDNLLVNTLDKGHQLLNMTSSVVEKAVFRNRIDKLRRIQTDLMQTRLTSGLRVAPFVVSFFGCSAQGKSSIAKIFMTSLLEANGFAATPEYICSVNENDKFLSTYRSCVNGVYLDDVANAKSDFVERPPSQILIDLNNNVPTYAIQAEADKKGKVVIEPKIVICTTNVKDLGATVYSNEPVSIARRANLHVTTVVKPEFATNGMLDSAKVFERFPDGTCPIQDVWNLTVQEVIAVKPIARGHSDQIGWQTVTFDGKELRDVGIEDALRCAVAMSRKHFLHQKRVVDDANNLQSRLQVCKPCGMPHVFCSCPIYGPYFPGQCECGLRNRCEHCVKGNGPPQICSTCDKILPSRAMVEAPEYNADYNLAVNHYCHCFGRPYLLQEDYSQNSEWVFTPDTFPGERKYEGQFGEMLAGCVSTFLTRWLFKSRRKVTAIETRLEDYATAKLFTIAESLERSWMVQWTNWIPRRWLSKSWCKDLVCYMEKETILGYARNQLWSLAGALSIGAGLAIVNRPVPILLPSTLLLLWYHRHRASPYVILPITWISSGAPLLTVPPSVSWAAASSIAVSSYCLPSPSVHIPTSVIVSACLGLCMYHVRNVLECKRIVFSEIVKRNDAIPAMVAAVREGQVSHLLKYCAIVGAIYGICKVWSLVRIVPESQGCIAPMSEGDIERRDAEQNPWAIPEVKPLPCTLKSKSVTHEVLKKLVFDNLAFMTCEIDGKRHSCDAFFPFSNVAIIPQHAWKQDTLDVTFTRKSPTSVGANFSSFLSRSCSVHIPNSDFCVVWVPNGGDWKDLRKYFPLDTLRQCFATMVYKDRDGELIEGQTTLIFGQQQTMACEKFFGCSYVLPFQTFRGLCMAPLVSKTNGPMIVGFHVGGVQSSPHGCGGMILMRELDSALTELAQLPGVLLSKSSGTVRPMVYDVQWFEGPQIHPKSPVNFLPVGAYCDIYGSCIGRAKYFSEVLELPISKTVAEVMGVPKMWGKPKFSSMSWRDSLIHSTNPTKGVEPGLLQVAYDDYTHELDTILLSPRWKKLVDDTKPLTNMQTVCGIDGKRFIDKMPPNTSVGFPLTGPKSDYLERLDPEDFPDFNCPAVIDPRFWEQWMECERCYLSGERAYPVFKACLKDEPTSLAKDKVRVFQAAPIALQLGVRKYFLPLARILSLFPLVSECAVGVNAQSPEWHQLMTHVGRFGQETTLAGDYSKYDLRMPAQLTFAAFRVLLHIAQRCGYNEYDIIIMSGLATDICYPLMAYNGDLIQHYGSNPSGQNLTVYINCIVNSLLFRCGAYSLLPGRFDRFSSICALITYGDDADSTVHPDYPEFNHISFAKFLGERGMEFTMPDKSSVPREYMSRSESHFLKRESKLLGDTGILCGALEESSIFKSLHCVLKSKVVSTMEQSIFNLDGAAREFFFHGPEVYEMRRQQLVEVATRHNILPLCRELALSFQDRLALWKDQYLSDSESH